MFLNNCTTTTTSTTTGNNNNLTCILLDISTGTSTTTSDSDDAAGSGADSQSQQQQEVLLRLEPLISDDIRLKLEIVLQISLFTVTSLFGTVANIVNITVYWKQGLRDSITVGLFALSVSDFFVVFLPLFTSACYMADHLFPGSPITYKAVAGVSATQARHLVYSLSCTLTAFLSIERCFCVVRPFKVKLIFTRTRTIVVVVSMAVFYVIAFVPMFATYQLQWQTDPRRNFTDVYTLWLHPTAAYVTLYNTSLMSITIPTSAQVVVTCTAIIMISGLRKASKFRRSATDSSAGGGASVLNNNGNRNNTLKQVEGNTSPDNESKTQTKNKANTNTNPDAEVAVDSNKSKKKVHGGKIGEGLDSRDRRLVKTMLILVVILSVANIPYIALKYTQLIVPEMNPRKRYANLFRLMSSINFLLASLNASVNALVYYYTGSRYREIFNSTFCKKSKG